MSQSKKSDDSVKKYSNGEIIVEWRAHRCIHSGNCVRGLPEVFDPKARPWINVAAASTAELRKQVDNCPSGALDYSMNEASQNRPTEASNEIKVSPKGPLLFRFPVTIIHPDGTEEIRTKATALCRCGGSSNKPYCDGSHRKNGFTG